MILTLPPEIPTKQRSSHIQRILLGNLLQVSPLETTIYVILDPLLWDLHQQVPHALSRPFLLLNLPEARDSLPKHHAARLLSLPDLFQKSRHIMITKKNIIPTIDQFQNSVRLQSQTGASGRSHCLKTMMICTQLLHLKHNGVFHNHPLCQRLNTLLLHYRRQADQPPGNHQRFRGVA